MAPLMYFAGIKISPENSGNFTGTPAAALTVNHALGDPAQAFFPAFFHGLPPDFIMGIKPQSRIMVMYSGAESNFTNFPASGESGDLPSRM